MPPRSTIFRLGEARRIELDGRIARAGYGGYEDHRAWLASEGHEVSLSALKRYGKRLKDRAEADSRRAGDAAAAVIARMRHTAEVARAAQGSGSDPLDMHEQAAELCMVRLYELAASDDIDAKTLQAVARALNTTLSTIAGARGQRDAESRKAVEQAKAAALDEVGRSRPAGRETIAVLRAIMEGRDPEEARREARMEAVKAVRRDVYGIEDQPDPPGLSDEAMQALDAALMPSASGE